jgi:hypothetical protein
MGRHRPVPRRASRKAAVLALLTVVVAVVCVAALLVWRTGDRTADPLPPAPSTTASCETALDVVTATSFERVLEALAPQLATGEDCARLNVTVVDGRAAAGRVAELAADVWIPDDTSWAGLAGTTTLAKTDVAGSGTVLATSPIYFLATPATAAALTQAGSSWRGLVRLLTGNSGMRMVVRDRPAPATACWPPDRSLRRYGSTAAWTPPPRH